MPEQVTSPEGEYSVIRRGEQLPEDFKQDYWMRVKRALREVFGKDPRQAERLRESVENASADTQTAFYHADPFDVAADLAGRRHALISPSSRIRPPEEPISAGLISVSI
jgi:hypothetical protein